jgi:hypothetical protein
MSKLKYYISLILILFTSNCFAQVRYFDFNILPLPSLDIGSIVVLNNLKNSQTIFQVTIEPSGLPVILEGKIAWKDNNASSYSEVFYFKTNKFISRNLSNNDIGNSDIKIAEHRTNSDLIKEVIKRGKPTGDYLFTINLLTQNGESYPGINSSIERHLQFSNPAPTLSISSPEANSVQDEGNVLAQWTPVIGASDYLVKVGVRTNSSQGLEDALSSGTPLANNKSVGNVTSVNLRTVLDRQWSRDQEIVFQVIAIAQGSGGDNKIYSQPVNFKFNNGNSDSSKTTNAIRNKMQFDALKEKLMHFNNSAIQKFFANGASIIGTTDENGSQISETDLQKIIDYLNNNPDKITGVDSK